MYLCVLISLLCNFISLPNTFTVLLTILSYEMALFYASVRCINSVVLIQPANSRSLYPSTWLRLYTLNRQGWPAFRPKFTEAFQSFELWVRGYEQHSYLLVKAKYRLDPLPVELIAVLQDLREALLFYPDHTLVQYLQNNLILHYW
jgi:hypothetical protein